MCSYATCIQYGEFIQVTCANVQQPEQHDDGWNLSPSSLKYKTYARSRPSTASILNCLPFVKKYKYSLCNPFELFFFPLHFKTIQRLDNNFLLYCTNYSAAFIVNYTKLKAQTFRSLPSTTDKLLFAFFPLLCLWYRWVQRVWEARP